MRKPQNCFPQWLGHFTFTTNNVQKFPISPHILTSTCYVPFLFFLLFIIIIIAILVDVKWYFIIAFICIFLIVKDIEQAMSFLPFVYLLWEMSGQVLCHLKYWSVFLCCCCWVVRGFFFYVLAKNPLRYPRLWRLHMASLRILVLAPMLILE